MTMSRNSTIIRFVIAHAFAIGAIWFQLGCVYWTSTNSASEKKRDEINLSILSDEPSWPGLIPVRLTLIPPQGITNRVVCSSPALTGIPLEDQSDLSGYVDLWLDVTFDSVNTNIVLNGFHAAGADVDATDMEFGYQPSNGSYRTVGYVTNANFSLADTDVNVLTLVSVWDTYTDHNITFTIEDGILHAQADGVIDEHYDLSTGSQSEDGSGLNEGFAAVSLSSANSTSATFKVVFDAQVVFDLEHDDIGGTLLQSESGLLVAEGTFVQALDNGPSLDPVLLDIAILNPSNFLLSWNAEIDVPYRVDWSTNLSDDLWQQVHANPLYCPSNGTMEYTVFSTNNYMFYRVRSGD